jgi:hypothetical protein
MTDSVERAWRPDTAATTRDTYVEELSATIREHVAHRSPVSLSDLIRACKGAFPTLVMEHVTRMLGDVHWTQISALATASTAHYQSRIGDLQGNPVLSSWYFSAATCGNIAGLRDWSHERLAFLGTPRLYEWFAERRLGQTRVLFDLDATILRALADLTASAGDRQVTYDAGCELPDVYVDRFDYVFFDPPWYPEHYVTWLRRACRLAPHGTLIFPLFPRLTRPSAAAERNQIVRPLNDAGVSIWTISAFAEYVVPSFERAELRAAGLDSLELWKAADVIIAELAGLATVVEFDDLQLDETSWAEVDLGSIRIFADLSRRSSDKRFAFLPEGWTRILVSPSRRDPQRAQANVLTSRGHGFMTSDPVRLVEWLGDVARSAHSLDDVRRAIADADIDGDSKTFLNSILAEG